MAVAAFLRAKTLSKKTTRARNNDDVVLICAKHNLRELPMPSKRSANYPALRYDSTKNKILAGPSTAAEVAALAKSLICAAKAGAIRVNATMAVELVVSLPAGFYVDSSKYFSEALQWVVDYFQVPVLSAVCHFDQVQPHMHILLLPLRAGQWLGSSLLGPRSAIRTMQQSFRTAVAMPHGLGRSDMREQRRTTAQQVVRRLQTEPHLMNSTSVALALVDSLSANPAAVLSALRFASV
jgi:hypothetical protein